MVQPQLVSRAVGLGEQVAEVLRRQIITQEIPSGTLLVETKLAEEFQVSRGPVREAIRALAQEGLVSTAGRSASVIGLTAHDIDEVFTLRAALEHLAMHSAMTTSPNRLLELQHAALVEMLAAVEARDAVAFTHADLRFHDCFYRASGHRRVADVADQYRPTIENLLLVANLDHSDLLPSYEAHALLNRLVAEGDPDMVAQELESHLDNSRRRVRGEYTGAE